MSLVTAFLNILRQQKVRWALCAVALVIVIYRIGFPGPSPSANQQILQHEQRMVR